MLLLAFSLAAVLHPHGTTCVCPDAGPAVAQPVHRSGTITDDDYPASALKERAEGSVRFRLDVGADGRVTGCTILESSGNSSLDSATCSLAQRRFRFTPARDAQGQPVAGHAIRAVRWAMPVLAPAMPPPPPGK